MLLRELLSQEDAWEVVTFDDELDSPIAYMSQAAAIA